MNKKIRGLVILGCLLLVFSINNAVQAQIDTATLEIFRAAILAHGGDKLDNLKTLRIKNSTSKSEENITLFDLTNQKYRVERRNNNKLEITQLEGNEGWKWIDSEKKQLSEAETQALKIQLCHGYMRRRSECLKYFPLPNDIAGFNFSIDRISENSKEVIVANRKRLGP
ncbi:MAG: hypothetical protein HC846_05510 [Blastocatellia bacterium]|nr:hypothetical protein [Blastocatellia bacterium]